MLLSKNKGEVRKKNSYRERKKKIYISHYICKDKNPVAVAVGATDVGKREKRENCQKQKCRLLHA